MRFLPAALIMLALTLGCGSNEEMAEPSEDVQQIRQDVDTDLTPSPSSTN